MPLWDLEEDSLLSSWVMVLWLLKKLLCFFDETINSKFWEILIKKLVRQNFVTKNSIVSLFQAEADGGRKNNNKIPQR